MVNSFWVTGFWTSTIAKYFGLDILNVNLEPNFDGAVLKIHYELQLPVSVRGFGVRMFYI